MLLPLWTEGTRIWGRGLWILIYPKQACYVFIILQSVVNFKVVNTCKFWRDAIIYVLLEFGACLPIKLSAYYHWLENIAIKTGQTCEFTVDLLISVGNKIVRFKDVWLKNRILRSKNLVFWYSDCNAWLLNLKTLAYFQSKIEFTSKHLVFRSKYQVSQKYVTNGFHNL